MVDSSEVPQYSKARINEGAFENFDVIALANLYFFRVRMSYGIGEVLMINGIHANKLNYNMLRLM